MLRSGEEPPPGDPSWYLSGQGYVRLRWATDAEYIEAYEHRLVAGAVRGQHVHHIDGDRTNNNPSNLRVLTPEEHSREHAENGSGAASKTPGVRIDASEAERLYLSGLGTELIGKKMGHDPAAVWRVLKRHGVAMRPSFGGGPQRKTDLA